MKKYIKPARAGLLVRKADGQRLSPEGETLPMSAWWHRRAAEGDVIIADIPAASPQTRAVKEK